MNKIAQWYHDILGEIEKLLGMHPAGAPAAEQKAVILAKVAKAPSQVTQGQKDQVEKVVKAHGDFLPVGATGPTGVAGSGPTVATGASGATGAARA